MSDIDLKSPNCYPNCSNNFIKETLIQLNPCIDIAILKTSMLLQGVDESLIKTFTKFLSGFGKDRELFTNKPKPVTGSNVADLDYLDDFKVGGMSSIYGLFSLLSTITKGVYHDIPIFSSPNIRIDNGAGWKNTQSLNTFIQTLATTGTIGKLIEAKTGDTGKSIIGGVGGSLEALAQLTGWDPQVSPYFSFQANPFSYCPEFQVEIQLINDCVDSVKRNADFLDAVIKNTLIGTGTARASYGTNYGWHLTSRWWPPQLLTVGLKFGAESMQYAKIFHLCTLSASVEPKGLMRELTMYNAFGNGLVVKVPDVYTVNMTFRSILPDTLDAWSNSGFPGITGANSAYLSDPDYEKDEESVKTTSKTLRKEVEAQQEKEEKENK